MDSLIVDLDKVLDDFEAEENSEVLAPGHEIRQSGFEEYLEQHNEAPWKVLAEVPLSTDPQLNYTTGSHNSQDNHDRIADTKARNVMYDIPYEPTDKFDMSEADFAPSPTVGDKCFNGSIYDQGKQLENGSHLNSLEQHQKRDLERNLQNQYDLSYDRSNAINLNYVHNNLGQERGNYPVQAADMSPDAVPNHASYQTNGYLSYATQYQPEQNNTENVETVKQQPLEPVAPVTEPQYTDYGKQQSDLSSLEHNKSVGSEHDDKLPIQCNTPQTPKDNPFANPFDNLKTKCDDARMLSNKPPEMLQFVSPVTDAFTMRSSQDLPIQNIPQLQPLKQELSTKRNDFQHMLQGESAYNSLPALSPALLLPFKVHNSLPTELEVTSTSHLQSEVQSTNNTYQNVITTSIANTVPAEAFIDATIRPETPETVNGDIMHGPGEVVPDSHGAPIVHGPGEVVPDSHGAPIVHDPGEVVPDSRGAPAVVGFGDTDVEVGEQDLADYLAQYAGENTEQQTQFQPITKYDHQNIVHNQQMTTEQMSVPGETEVDNVKTDPIPDLLMDDNDGTGHGLGPDVGSPVKMDTGEGSGSNVLHVNSDNGLHEHMQSSSSTLAAAVQDANTTSRSILAPGEGTSPAVAVDVGISEPAIDFSDLEIFTALPADLAPLIATTDPSSVINHSIAPESAHLTATENTNCVETVSDASPTDVSHVSGARPKELTKIQTPVHRPSSLQGLSVVDLNSESPFVVRPCEQTVVTDAGIVQLSPKTQKLIVNSVIKQAVNEETMQSMDVTATGGNNQQQQPANQSHGDDNEITSATGTMDVDTDDSSLEAVELRHPHQGQLGPEMGRPHSWSPINTGQAQVPKQKRPTSLNLPPRPQFTPSEDESPPGYEENIEGPALGATGVTSMETNHGYNGTDPVPEAERGVEVPFMAEEQPLDLGPPPPYSSNLGNVAPTWVPDAEAQICMSCDIRFTFTKRRHHCRACGKVYCSACCYLKGRLKHLGNREARVCVPCHNELAAAELWNEAMRVRGGPHPNNPTDYCSTIPPAHQATHLPPAPSVFVPVTGVLKHDGSNRRSEPKQVMFSDGIRPGGDLTELDGSSNVHRIPPRRSRVQKRVERVAQEGGQHSPRSRRLRTVGDRSSKCLIPEDGLPPLAVPGEAGLGYELQFNPDSDQIMPQIRNEDAPPVIFAISTNLYVLVKILNLDCCVNRVVWCFTTRGMASVGQDEIITVLEITPDEAIVPRDIFTHLNSVYEDASKGNMVTELGHTIFNQSFLGSRDHGGFLYVRATFQCVQKLLLPSPPFVFAILLQKWETPWAKVFPIRLLLRLGAEYRYYPCPLIGVRNRKPVYFEIGHTIMNLLADFRNYQYMLPHISGITIHMEDKVTCINLPRNRYDDLLKVVTNSNEHVMAMGATFSSDADSHLVCIQNDDGNYQTQAINIQNKPRKVTGASFVVFNGALKSTSGLSAKSSIVEDGLMVQIMPDSMLALKQAIRDMQDYKIVCGVVGAPKPDETVIVQWAADDKNVNIGVKSPIDKMALDGVQSLRIQNSTDYVGDKHVIRWTEIFFIENEDTGSVKWEPVDLSRLGETLATAFSLAITSQLDKLKQASLTKIGLRVRLAAEQVGYEVGARGERLPDMYMNELDNELIPVIHRALQGNHDGPVVLELIFQILD